VAWIRGLSLEDLEVVGKKVQDGRIYTYLATRLENGGVAWACVVQDGDQERVAERGLVPRVVVEWLLNPCYK